MVPKPPAFLGEEDSNLGPWAWTAMALTLITLWPWWGHNSLRRAYWCSSCVFLSLSLFCFCFFS